MRQKVVISGSRSITDRKVIKKILDRCLSDGIIDTEAVIIHGGCESGVDQYADWWAKRRDLRVQEVPADWDTHGKAAGPIRNRQMITLADLLIAIWDGNSRGTKSTILAAADKGIN